MDADQIRFRLRDPRELCSALGLLERAKPQAFGVLVRCPAHDERTASCSVTRGPDGTIRVRCFGCNFTGDVFTLIAAVHKLDIQRDFRRVLEFAARLCGHDATLESETAPQARRARAAPAPERPYPPWKEVSALWARSMPVTSDPEVSGYFTERGLDLAQLDTLDLVRVLSPPVPPWAAYGSRSWIDTKHRAIVPMFDERGVLRSLRAIHVCFGGDLPKRLPPKGYRAGAIVMANSLARIVLASGTIPSWWPEGEPFRLVLCEGEPDFLTWASEFSDSDVTAPAVIGIVSGSWTGAMAARVPDGARVIIRTHHDQAGDSYANDVHATLAHRCTVLRSKASP